LNIIHITYHYKMLLYGSNIKILKNNVKLGRWLLLHDVDIFHDFRKML